MGGMTKSRSAYGLQIELKAGANANTNIAVTGIAVTDEIVCVIELTTAAAIASAADITANCSITSAGNIQSTSSTASNQVWIFWNKLSL
jgi:hypothetical protein